MEHLFQRMTATTNTSQSLAPNVDHRGSPVIGRLIAAAFVSLCLTSCATRALFTSTPKTPGQSNAANALLPAAVAFDAGTLPVQLAIGAATNHISPLKAPHDPRQRTMSAKAEYARWCKLGDAAKRSLARGRDADAKSFAEELEQLAQKYTKDWNYGNAIADYNIVLGRLALKSGNVATARKRLLAAGRSPGSPTLDTFGPNMALAKELLTKGGRIVVLAYFELCRRFWKDDDGKLDKWKKDVAHGRAPDFGANLDY